MADDKKQTQEIINDMPVEDGVKKGLLEKLESEGVSDDLIVEMKVALTEAQVDLQKDHQPQIQKLRKLVEGEQKELDKAYETFEKEMDELEEDTEALDKAVTESLDKQQAKDLKQSLDS